MADLPPPGAKGDGNLIIKMILPAAVLLMASSSVIADELLDYGKYLSGECTTCHQIDGTHTEGIPPINGLDSKSFIMAMNSFKNGERDNPAMVSVAKNLDDEQLKALAAYFGSLQSAE
jgi:cytochrome c553